MAAERVRRAMQDCGSVINAGAMRLGLCQAQGCRKHPQRPRSNQRLVLVPWARAHCPLLSPRQVERLVDRLRTSTQIDDLREAAGGLKAIAKKHKVGAKPAVLPVCAVVVLAVLPAVCRDWLACATPQVHRTMGQTRACCARELPAMVPDPHAKLPQHPLRASPQSTSCLPAVCSFCCCL